MSDCGDFNAGGIIYDKFTTRQASGVPTVLSGTPSLSIYKADDLAQSTAGVTLTANFDSVAGLNHYTIDTSADGTFYADGGQYNVVIAAGTVNSVSVVGEVVGRFSIRAQATLYPTTAGRKLDVSAGGEAGIDWNNVGSPTTAVDLSGTTIKTSQVIASVSGAVGSVSGNVGGNVTGSVGSVVGAVGSVTGAVGSVTGLTASNLDTTVSSRLASSSYTAPPTANQNADALLDRTAGVETGVTPRQGLRAMIAALAGKLSGATGTTIHIRDTNDTKDRVVATVDSDGNRTAVTLDLT